MKVFLLTLVPLLPVLVLAQSAQAPMPDVPTLLREVEEHQHALDQVRENYTYHETTITHELDKNGKIKKSSSEEAEVFFVNTHEIRRKIKKDGKPLSSDEQQKEQQRVEKAVEKAIQDPPGQSTYKNQVSVSRLLQLMKVSAPRREQMDGRSVLVFDFTGDPHARTHGAEEAALKKISGTVWVDEQDRQVRRMTATFDDNFHLGFGLFSVGKGSRFTFDQKLINNELWLPTGAQIHLVAHALGVLGWRGDVQITDDDYQKFHVDASQQSGATVVHESGRRPPERRPSV